MVNAPGGDWSESDREWRDAACAGLRVYDCCSPGDGMAFGGEGKESTRESCTRLHTAALSSFTEV